jgi:predicted Zn finger-like uncharacterized protein
MPTILPCPSCQRQLSLPDEAAGKLVRCPQCGNTFTAPGGSIQAAPSMAPPPVPTPDTREDDDYDDREPPRRRRRYDDDYDDYGIVRRHGEPHRGPAILAIAIIGLVSLATGACFFLGIILGPIAWIMGSSDLTAMAAGRMDRSGEGITQAGWIIGIIVTILSMLAFALVCLWFAFVLPALAKR